MAEIRVEPKRGGAGRWLWIIIALLLIAALAYWFLVANPQGSRGAASALQATLEVALSPWHAPALT